MATEYKLKYTGSEIDEKLDKIDNAVLCIPQELTEEQKAHIRANIGASAVKVNLNNGVLSIE